VVVLPQLFFNIKSIFLRKYHMKKKGSKFLKKLGSHLLSIRLAKGLSQEEVSYRCEVDRAKISKIETGTANCNITTRIELAKGLGITTKQLLDF
jgi:ribosome-binding protein aMBF1 (putative translation factor)